MTAIKTGFGILIIILILIGLVTTDPVLLAYTFGISAILQFVVGFFEALKKRVDEAKEGE